jgi:hypothetical protein
MQNVTKNYMLLRNVAYVLERFFLSSACAQQSKPGVCPTVTDNISPAVTDEISCCIEECVIDFACPGIQKCCDLGGSTICVDPLGTKNDTQNLISCDVIL